MKTDIFSKLQSCRTEEERHWIVVKLSLERLSQDVQNAIWAAVIPQWFNNEFLNALLDYHLTDQEFNELTSQTFVEVFPGRGFNIHERTQELLRNKLWKENKKQYLIVSKKAANYCALHSQNEMLCWKVEMLYHSILADQNNALQKLQDQIAEWSTSHENQKIDTLIRPLLNAAHAGRVTSEAAAFILFVHGKSLVYYSRLQEAEKNIRLALQKTNEDSLKAKCNLYLGVIYKVTSNYPKAKEWLQKAKSINKRIGNKEDEAEAVFHLSDVHIHLQEFNPAIEQLEYALSINNIIENPLGKANCFFSLGEITRYLKQYEQAKKQFKKALTIYQKIPNQLGEANCLKALSRVYINLTKYDIAYEQLEKSLSIYKKIKDRLGEANSFSAFGELYRQQKKYGQAIRWFEKAISNYQKIGNLHGEANCIFDLAEIYSDRKEYAHARELFGKVLLIWQQIGEVKKYKITKSQLDKINKNISGKY